MSLTPQASRLKPRAFSLKPQAQDLAFLMLVALGLIAAFLAARRLAGAFVEPLGTLGLLLAGLTVAVAALSIRLAWRRGGGQFASWHDHLLRFGPLVCVLTLAATLWLPGSPVFGIFLLCGVLMAEEAWSCRPSAWDAVPRSEVLIRKSEQDQPWMEGVPHSDFQSPTSLPPHPGPLPEGEGDMVIQRLTRTLSPAGVDSLHGQVGAPLATGQLRASLHVAFCPPFERTPELEFEQMDGPEARVTLGQLLPYGVRLDVKLREAVEEPTAVTVEFFANLDDPSGAE